MSFVKKAEKISEDFKVEIKEHFNEVSDEAAGSRGLSDLSSFPGL
jgi:hypothetical protein